MSIKTLIKNLKSDPTKEKLIFLEESDLLEKLERFNEYILERIPKTQHFVNFLILKNFVCLYFGEYDTAPLNKIQQVTRKELLSLISDFEFLDKYIDKVNEILLYIVSDRIRPNWNFKFSIEVQKIGFCSKLYSFKMLNVRKMALVRLSDKKRKCAELDSETESKDLKFDLIKELEQVLQKTPTSRMVQEMKAFYVYCFAALQDNWLILAFNELVSLWTMKKLSMTFMDSIPGNNHCRIVAILFNQGKTPGLPIFQEVAKMKRQWTELKQRSQVGTMEAKKESSLLNLKLGGSGKLNPEGGSRVLLSDARSRLSDFSFNFFEERSVGAGSVFGDPLFQL